MSNIVDFEAAKEARQPHIAGEMQCLACGNVHAAVAPIGCHEGECPACGLFRAVWRNAIFPPDDALIYPCECGSVHFYLLVPFPMCIRCGLSREWPPS